VWALAVVVVLGAAGAFGYWWLNRSPRPASVSDAIKRFHQTQPADATHVGGPAVGVYVYATTGHEHITAGDITHTYPAKTTLTVTDTSCGLRLRWDALAGRWNQADLCHTALGWRLVHYTESHEFLSVQDIHDYTCAGSPVIVCKSKDGVMTLTSDVLGPAHLRISQKVTGKSVNTGTAEVWLLPDGLPQRAEVSNTGSSTVLGNHVVYTESASFTLTSTTPLQ
jgi:hypothetical protein